MSPPEEPTATTSACGWLAPGPTAADSTRTRLGKADDPTNWKWSNSSDQQFLSDRQGLYRKLCKPYQACVQMINPYGDGR